MERRALSWSERELLGISSALRGRPWLVAGWQIPVPSFLIVKTLYTQTPIFNSSAPLAPKPHSPANSYSFFKARHPMTPPLESPVRVPRQKQGNRRVLSSAEPHGAGVCVCTRLCRLQSWRSASDHIFCLWSLSFPLLCPCTQHRVWQPQVLKECSLSG